MITVTFKSEDGVCQGFHAVGHAGYGPEGQDIVCAAVSALTQGTVTALRELSSSTIAEERQSGNLRLQISDLDHVALTLLAGLEIALMELQTGYGTYIEVCHG